MVSIMFSGYAVGGIISALLGSFLVKDYGWEIMFYLAGIPLVGLPIIWRYLPESLTYLVKDNKQGPGRHIIQKIDPSLRVTDNTKLVLNEAAPTATGKPQDSSFKALFTEDVPLVH